MLFRFAWHYVIRALAFFGRMVRWLLAPRLFLKLMFKRILLLLILGSSPSILKQIWVVLRDKWEYYEHLVKVILYDSDESYYIKKDLLEALKEADTYHQWKADAGKLDEIEGNHKWKSIDRSRLYNFEKIQESVHLISQMIEEKKGGKLAKFLRARLLRNLGGICNPRLYWKTRTGTKELINKYLSTIKRALKYIVESKEMSVEAKLRFFLDLRHSYGRTALMLSGGGTLGLFHTGVIEALFQAELLPKIISGSSVGSIMGGIVCTKTKEEILSLNVFSPKSHQGEKKTNEKKETSEANCAEPDCDAPMPCFSEGAINWNFFPKHKTWLDGVKKKVHRFIQKGHFLDIKVLQRCVRAQMASPDNRDITFLEAYEKTGIVFNIAISGAHGSEDQIPRLLNYLTSPDVVIWSAAVASCSLPYIYQPVSLYSKIKTKDGFKLKEYFMTGEKWSDGSLRHDLPVERLKELFNVNNLIVSQVNPHVIPFVFRAPYRFPWLTNFYQQVAKSLGLTSLTLFNLIPNRIAISPAMAPLRFVRNIAAQAYLGDVNFIPRPSIEDFKNLLSNPSDEKLQRCRRMSRLYSYKQLNLIHTQCAIEFELDKCVRETRRMLIQKKENQAKAFELVSQAVIHTETKDSTDPEPVVGHSRRDSLRSFDAFAQSEGIKKELDRLKSFNVDCDIP